MSTEDTWQLKIPIRLSLSSTEITSPVDVKPVYLLAPRYAYLPALAEQCLKLFQHVLLSLPGQAAVSPWFEYQGLALNWTQPLGVLHDLLSPCHQDAATTAGAAPGPTQPAGAGFSAPASPWCLTVHYRNMPAALNNTWQNAGAAKDHYMSSLKEAGYCCRGSDGCGAVLRLPGQSQDELWAALNKGDGASARHIMTPLKLTPTPKPGGITASVPVRLYIRRHKQGSSSQELTNVWDQVYSTSRPVEATQPDGSPTLLAHLMHIAMPQRFPAPVTKPSSTQQQQQQQGHEEQQQQQQSQQNSQQQPSPAQQLQASAAPPSPGDPATADSQDTGNPLDAGRMSCAAGASSSSDQQGSSSQRAAAAAAGEGDAAGAVAGPAGSSEAPAAAAAPLTAAESGSKEGAKSNSKTSIAAASHVLPDKWSVGAAAFVCGVQPDWCTPIAWLHANLRAADCFLYVVVHVLDS